MQNERLNTASIESFIKTVKSADLSKQKEVRIDIDTARQLSYTLGMVVARLHGKLEDFIAVKQTETEEQVIQVTMDGGSSW